MSSKRSGSIDFLRFLLAVVIVFFHGRKLAGTGLFPRGATAVEAFFVISGYYMAREAFTKKTDALTYMKKRYVGLFPYHAFAFICAFVFRCYKNVKQPGRFKTARLPVFLLLLFPVMAIYDIMN